MCNPLLQLHQAIEYRSSPWRAIRDINVDWNDAINSLDSGVIVIETAAGRACAKCHNPFGFGHLFIDTLQNWRQLMIDSTDHHQQICLTWAEAGQKGAETVDIVG